MNHLLKNSLVHRIALRTQLDIQEIQVLSGADHVVLAINNNYIFRYAPTDAQRHKLLRETCLLQALQRQRFHCQIPAVLFDFAQQEGFIGYRTIEGEPLTSVLYQTLTPAEQQQLAQDLAAFLRQLHQALSFSQIEMLGITPATWPLPAQELTLRLEPFIAHSGLAIQWAHFLQDYKKCTHGLSTISLVHNDLHAGNMLIDPNTKKLTGIIDFSETVIDNPYLEFRYLPLISWQLLHDTVREYAFLGNTQPNYEQAILYYRATEFSRLVEAYEQNDSAKVVATIARIQQAQFLIAQ